MEVIVSSLGQQEIPGEPPVIGKQVPADAGDDQHRKQKRHQNADKLLHKTAPFQWNFKKLYNKTAIKSSIGGKVAVLRNFRE